MTNQYEKKITWKIKNFSSLQSEKVYSDYFVVGGSKWRLLAYPKGNGSNWRLQAYPKGNGVGINSHFSLFLEVADSESLPYGWKRHTKYRLTVVNQISENLSEQRVGQDWFDHKAASKGFPEMLPLTELVDINGGFLVNGQVKIVAEVVVLEVIGKSHVLEETSLVNECINVNGFQVPPSQVESVKSLFEKHPDIASKLHLKNSYMRITYLNSLLSLTEILCQSPENISNDDLANAYSTLSYVTKAGFKLDWLEKKLKEVGETRVQDIEEELKDMTRKCVDLEALLEFLR